MLEGGEDFELVFAVAPKSVRRVMTLAHTTGVAVTAIGRVVARPGLWLDDVPQRGNNRGFDYFR